MRPNPGLLAFLAPLILLVAGCGAEPGPARQSASGTITPGGKALDSGTITLESGENGAGAFGPVRDGAFRFESADGPPPADSRSRSSPSGPPA